MQGHLFSKPSYSHLELLPIIVNEKKSETQQLKSSAVRMYATYCYSKFQCNVRMWGIHATDNLLKRDWLAERKTEILSFAYRLCAFMRRLNVMYCMRILGLVTTPGFHSPVCTR